MIKKSKMLVSTTSTLEGWKIESYLGTISSHVVTGTGVFSDILASFSDFFGGRSESYQKQLTAITDEAIENLKHKAMSIGANAIVGLRIDHDQISGKDKQMFMVTAVGTAIKATCLEQTQQEVLNHYVVVNQDDFSSLVKRKQLIRSAKEGTLNLTDEMWDFLKENQVYELAKAVSLTLEQKYEIAYLDENAKWFINRCKEYFYSLPEDAAKAHLYDLLTRKNKVYNFAFELINKLGLLDVERISALLESPDFEIRKRALHLLQYDKRTYIVSDIGAFETLLRAIETCFPPRGEHITEKSLLSSKPKEFWKCECGSKVDVRQKYCYECSQDINGFKEKEFNSRQAIALIMDRISVLKELFIDRESNGINSTRI